MCPPASHDRVGVHDSRIMQIILRLLDWLGEDWDGSFSSHCSCSLTCVFLFLPPLAADRDCTSELSLQTTGCKCREGKITHFIILPLILLNFLFVCLFVLCWGCSVERITSSGSQGLLVYHHHLPADDCQSEQWSRMTGPNLEKPKCSYYQTKFRANKRSFWD